MTGISLIDQSHSGMKNKTKYIDGRKTFYIDTEINLQYYCKVKHSYNEVPGISNFASL